MANVTDPNVNMGVNSWYDENQKWLRQSKVELRRYEEMQRLTPTVTHEGEELLLLVPQIASMPAKALKKPIGSLSHLREVIVNALDFAITGI